jgi:hypothetical protein
MLVAAVLAAVMTGLGSAASPHALKYQLPKLVSIERL